MSKESGELGMKQPSLNKRIVGDNGWSGNSLSLLLYAFVLSVAFSALFSCTDMVPTKEVRLIDSLNGAAYAYRYRQLDSSCFFARQAYMKVNLYKSGKAEAANNLGFWLYMKMDAAYAYRYRQLDSSCFFARQAYMKVNLYKSGKAEAANNLGFWLYMKMDFERAAALHKEVYQLTKNELELLIADIGLMKICQRTAMNKEFYDYRNSALKRMKRIREESDLFADRHEKLRLDYAFTEFYLVSSIYYYFLQQRQEAKEAIRQIPANNEWCDTSQLLYYHYIKGAAGLVEGRKPADRKLREFDQLYYTWRTAAQSGFPYFEQLLYYHYIKGAAGLVEGRKPADRKLREFDQLYYTWRTAAQSGFPYFEGNGLQGLADLLISPRNFEFFQSTRMHILQELGVPVDSLLPLRLAQLALQKFREYDDLYQIAGAYVSIGKYLNRHGRYAEALDTLTKALDCVNLHHMLYYHHGEDGRDQLYPYIEGDTTYTGVPWITQEQVKTVPEWISRIREQLSVSYAGLGMKAASDYNRNIYLDILNFTRQDKELESRYDSLEAGSRQMTLVLSLVLLGLVWVIILWWFFNKRSKIKNQTDVNRLQQILALCRDITSSIPMDVPLIQRGLDALFGRGRMMLEISEEGKAALVSRHWLSRDEKALVHVLEPYISWAADNEQMLESLSEERMQLEKQRYIYEQHIAGNKRQNLVKKACLAIVNGVHPYIDRILNEVHKLIEKGYIHDDKIKKEKYEYINELVDTINEYNDILALWIKMKQGTLSLNIETFALNELFDLLSKGRRSFEMKKQLLEVEPTDVCVKADRALTLFMINTLAENARKYTPEGGWVKVYARSADSYVEISVEDNGRGISKEDVSQMMDEKVYDSSQIGMKNADDLEDLKKNKGSGFGLMNCKGIIEKYKKINALFHVCTFSVESELGKGSRFYFRLPLGVRKVMTVLLAALLPWGLSSCTPSASSAGEALEESLVLMPDSSYEDLLDAASDLANDAYFANVDENYEQALQYVDSAMKLLNEHYELYSISPQPHHEMKLVGEGVPAEIGWWNELFDTDYHVILDIRNEAAVAFLALKQLEGYDYNNAAFTDLYKLQGEDKTLETYCRQLERSNINKTIGIILCFVLLFVLLVGYYFLYMRKRMLNRLNLEQVLDINQKVFAASLLRPQEKEDEEALQKEENTLKEIPRQIVCAAFSAVDELLGVDRMGIAVYNEAARSLEYASYPEQPMPDMVQQSFDSEEFLVQHPFLAIPLKVEVAHEHRCVGVLYLERRGESEQITDRLLFELVARYVAIVVFNAVMKMAVAHEHRCVGVLYLERRGESEQITDRLLFELVARYVAIVVFNAVMKMATQYRDIESAHEEARRASWEDSMLHVQNMVLDNCLSTIKHETLYYPNKIKQIDIESAHEEARRASWEDSMLHVQNMVLDNCLSTIKHETLYYPNKIKQIVGRLTTQALTAEEELEAVNAMIELIEYYKGIFTVLSSCASRQLEEVTFRRTVIPVQELFESAGKYFKKATRNRPEKIVLQMEPADARVQLEEVTFRRTVIPVQELFESAGKYFKKATRNRPEKIVLQMEPADARVVGDVNQLRFLLENLIDEALTLREEGVLHLQAFPEQDYVRFSFTDRRREKSADELHQLFYPNLVRMTAGEKGVLSGTEYLICKQIIRDHDEFAGRRGCRINAEPAAEGGFTVYFTVPRR